MNETGVVCHINFFAVKIIKLKKIKTYRTDGNIRNFKRSTSLADSYGMYCCNLHYCVIQDGLNYQFLLYQDCYV